MNQNFEGNKHSHRCTITYGHLKEKLVKKKMTFDTEMRAMLICLFRQSSSDSPGAEWQRNMKLNKTNTQGND